MKFKTMLFFSRVLPCAVLVIAFAGCNDAQSKPPAPMAGSFEEFEPEKIAVERPFEGEVKPIVNLKKTEFFGDPVRDGVLRSTVSINGELQHTEYYEYNGIWQLISRKIAPAGCNPDVLDDKPFILETRYSYDTEYQKVATITSLEGETWTSRREYRYENGVPASYSLIEQNPMVRMNLATPEDPKEVDLCQVNFTPVAGDSDRVEWVRGGLKFPQQMNLKPRKYLYDDKGRVSEIQELWPKTKIMEDGSRMPVFKDPEKEKKYLAREEGLKVDFDDFVPEVQETTKFTYDEAGRLIRREMSDMVGNISEDKRLLEKVEHEYNDKDLVIKSTHYFKEYSPMPNLARALMPGRSWEETHEYDDKGRRVRTMQKKDGMDWTIEYFYEE